MRTIGVMMAAAAILAGTAGAAWAQTAQEKAVEARKANFKKFGASMKAMTGFVRNDVGTAADVQAAAGTIAGLAPNLTKWFPAGTAVGVGKSEALPAIWDKANQAEFQKFAANLGVEANKMVAVAKSGDKAAIGAQLGALGGTCKACHDKYKED